MIELQYFILCKCYRKMVPRLLKLYGTFFANKIRKTYVT